MIINDHVAQRIESSSSKRVVVGLNPTVIAKIRSVVRSVGTSVVHHSSVHHRAICTLIRAMI